MGTRVKKVRKSAILEHLLDLERQIRAELAKASADRDSYTPAAGRGGRKAVRDETMSRETDGMVATDIAQRYLH